MTSCFCCRARLCFPRALPVTICLCLSICTQDRTKSNPANAVALWLAAHRPSARLALPTCSPDLLQPGVALRCVARIVFWWSVSARGRAERVLVDVARKSCRRSAREAADSDGAAHLLPQQAKASPPLSYRTTCWRASPPKHASDESEGKNCMRA